MTIMPGLRIPVSIQSTKTVPIPSSCYLQGHLSPVFFLLLSLPVSPFLSLSLFPTPSHLSRSLFPCVFRATISVAMATAAQLSLGLGPQPTKLASGDRATAPVIGCLVGKQDLETI